MANAVILARALGPESRGVLSFSLSIAIYLTAGFNFFASSNPILVARDGKCIRELISHSFFFAMLIMAFELVSYFPIFRLGQHSESLSLILPPKIFLVLIALNVVQILFASFSGLLLGLQDYFYRNYAAMLLVVANLVINVILVLLMNMSVPSALASLLVSNLICLMFMWRRLAKTIDWTEERAAFSWSVFFEGVRIGARASLSGFLTVFVFRLDIFLVQYFLGASALGIYSVAINTSEVSLALSSVVNLIIFSKSTSGVGIEGKAIRAGFYCFLASLSFAFFLFAAGWWIIPVAYGSDFRGAVFPCLIMVSGICVWSWAAPYVGYIHGKSAFPMVFVKIMAGGVVMSLALEILLIPLLGLIGAAIARAISYAVLGFALISLFHTTTKQPFRGSVSFRGLTNDIFRLGKEFFAPV
ncbi:MAG TPA: oligosaccharide flippase family protein [Candidatus Omnitrophota bacterium]|nr:oligosaccharide flippase family protein [Candidatus Omnitrophota bacterium]